MKQHVISVLDVKKLFTFHLILIKYLISQYICSRNSGMLLLSLNLIRKEPLIFLVSCSHDIVTVYYVCSTFLKIAYGHSQQVLKQKSGSPRAKLHCPQRTKLSNLGRGERKLSWPIWITKNKTKPETTTLLQNISSSICSEDFKKLAIYKTSSLAKPC